MAEYGAVVDRLKALGPEIQLRRIDRIAGFPVYSATINPTATASSMWISTGIHGDEPAGTEAALTFLEEWRTDRFAKTKVLVTPCLNPYSYQNDRRENQEGIDVNWAFDREDVAEIRMIKKLIEGVRFDAVIDLHEDWESAGYYLYEQVRGRTPLGFQITQRVQDYCPINREFTIEGEMADRGVIFPNLEVAKRKKGEGVPVEVFNRVTDHQITSESPTVREMGARVKAHLVAIEVLLTAYGQG